MKLSGKVIAAIAVVGVLVALLLFSQKYSKTAGSRSYNLTAHDMEVLVGEIMPPPQQQALASSAEQKQTLAKRLKELLAIAQVAEQKGFADKADVQSQITLQTDLALRDAYDKKNPGVKLEDDEVNKYLAEHPKEFDTFLDANPQFKMQAQGPQAEGMKKEFAQIKILAARARNDKLDQDEAFQLRALLERSNVLARAYITDLQEGDKLVTDADIEQYYNEHKDEFEEVRARHILISTSPEPDEDKSSATDAKDKKEADKKPKVLTKDEAKKKAQAILERVRKGEDFARLAEENSADPGSKTKGGDLGYFAKGAMVPEFDKAAFSLKPGEISDLVETSFGFHIIKVEDHRSKPLTDEATKKQIADKVKQKKVEDHIKEIAEKSNVQVAEEFNVTPKPMEPQPQMQLPMPDGGAQQMPASPHPTPKTAPGKTEKPSGAKSKNN